MRPFPIDPPADAATGEFVKFGFRSRRQTVLHFGLRDGNHRAVAGQAAGERTELTGQVESLHDLPDLFLETAGAHPGAPEDAAVLQEIPIPGQDDARFPLGFSDQLFIREIVAVDRVESEASQAAGQLAQMDVQDERRTAQRFRPQPKDGGDVQRLENRIDGDPVSGFEVIMKIHRPPVDQDQVHFGVRDADGLNGVLHRRAAPKRIREIGLPPFRREEIVQFLVETEPSRPCRRLHRNESFGGRPRAAARSGTTRRPPGGAFDLTGSRDQVDF